MQLTTYWRRMVGLICGAGCVGVLVLYWNMNYPPSPDHTKGGMILEVPMSPADYTICGLTNTEARVSPESTTGWGSRSIPESRPISGKELIAQNTWARVQEHYGWKRLLRDVRELWGMSPAEWWDLFLDHYDYWVFTLQLFLARLVN